MILTGSTKQYPLKLEEPQSSWMKRIYPAYLNFKCYLIYCLEQIMTILEMGSWGSERPKYLSKNTCLIFSGHRILTYIFPTHHVASNVMAILSSPTCHLTDLPILLAAMIKHRLALANHWWWLCPLQIYHMTDKHYVRGALFSLRYQKNGLWVG